MVQATATVISTTSAGSTYALPGTVVVGNVPAQLFAARPTRRMVEVTNQDAQFSVVLVPPGWTPPAVPSGTPWVRDGTAVNAVVLPPQTTKQMPFSGELWAAVDPEFTTGTVLVSVVDYYA